ncbi:glycosyltransferase [Chitinophagaceae bacterium LB-8]|uniref:Glycosyltransferase n=1 Tax=Paraflavisolibacter caeni TaxID=2982496 RepID=A0A9X2XTU2_9BACT|nr:glycosyltransferase family 2 protein [Paraflavisolibacter caeni]MCU7548281.1 glycosyltransferase [Paraflavisolibacter caeni]
MILTETTISIIISTHNRVHSVKRLLDKLGSQTYAVQLIEVIVVAYGCTDNTVAMLQNYKAPFKFIFYEMSVDEPAKARNNGASLASGSLFIFIGDDVEPSEGFAEAHMLAHQNKEDAVVIGYLPLALAESPDYYQIDRQANWEERFQRMRIPGYRYSYKDFSCSNFSISSDLFKKAQGFVSGLHYRDDYEFGIRLINLGANFIFSKDAWGIHRDEITDIHRFLKRKREDGKADVRLWCMHRDMIIPPLQMSRFKKKYSFLLYKKAFLLLASLKITDTIASCLKYLMFVLEKLQLRSKWKALNYHLHRYWYLRGWLDELPDKQKMFFVPNYIMEQETPDVEFEIDLKPGILAATQKLDQLRPRSVNICYGKQIIGSIPFKPGAERINGDHLRYLLATELSESFMVSFSLENDELIVRA